MVSPPDDVVDDTSDDTEDMTGGVKSGPNVTNICISDHRPDLGGTKEYHDEKGKVKSKCHNLFIISVFISR